MYRKSTEMLATRKEIPVSDMQVRDLDSSVGFCYWKYNLLNQKQCSYSQLLFRMSPVSLGRETGVL